MAESTLSSLSDLQANVAPAPEAPRYVLMLEKLGRAYATGK
ncbi:MAG: 30S ribosomal protein S9, partial [Methylocystis sp.]